MTKLRSKPTLELLDVVAKAFLAIPPCGKIAIREVGRKRDACPTGCSRVSPLRNVQTNGCISKSGLLDAEDWTQVAEPNGKPLPKIVATRPELDSRVASIKHGHEANAFGVVAIELRFFAISQIPCACGKKPRLGKWKTSC